MSERESLSKAAKKKRKASKNKTLFYKRWSFYFVLLIIFVLVMHGTTEWLITIEQPSEGWSIGYKALEGLPTDERLISVSESTDGNSYIVAYKTSTSIVITSLNLYGKVQAEAKLSLSNGPILAGKLKLVKVAPAKDTNYLYYGDRVSLYRVAFDASLKNIEAPILVSEHAEQFDVDGEYVIAGDDTLTQVFREDQMIREIDGYDNLKSLVICSDDETVYAGVNTDKEGMLYQVNSITGAQQESVVMNQNDQRFYGYFKDIKPTESSVTIITSLFDHLNPGAPSVLGVWQYNRSSLDQENFTLFYHVRTSLEPILTHIEGDQVSYILGVQQTLDNVSKGLSRYPQVKGGIYTNISYFSRQGDTLTENTRLTLTRKYPIAYYYFENEGINQLIWIDKESNGGVLMMAGNTPDWIQFAKANQPIDLVKLSGYTLVALANTVFLGLVSFLISLSDYNIWIFVTLIAIVLFRKFARLDQNKKDVITQYILMGMVLVIGVVMVAAPDSAFRLYQQIYPWFFGSTVALIAIPSTIGLVALGLYYLWKKEHYYYTNWFLHFSFFLGMYLFFYMFVIMSFFVSAMMKSHLMM
ncbi:MAG: hypothetical protein BGO41_06825 [Clostridiales bacterium 38-18]|nr:MAG: hypothetical protein BGO41_06825 [Clostridiales bacterium 38-18]